MPAGSGTVTVTGTLGPDKDVTSLLFENVVDLDFQFDRRVLVIKQSTPPSKYTEFDYSLVTAVTFTIAGTLTTVVVS